ncbi:MAG TPA: endonuclease/exonuclease/phosphatase family protein, partial [Acidimicrobiales bacterium]|nr:endonuclease/exonuclease/phosphatase family protein [Acidimicrobiales bacterium]
QLEAVLVQAGVRLRLLVVHIWAPIGRRGIARWHAQLAELAARMHGLGPVLRSGPPPGAPVGKTTSEPAAPRELPTVVVGDFNSTRQHRSFGRLVGPGWSEAGTIGFGGWRATWPANRRWRPAMLNIDHILAGPGISVLRGRAAKARGSDHRPIMAVLGLPRGL